MFLYFCREFGVFQIQTKINAQPFGSHLPPKKTQLLLVTLCEWQVGVAERNPTANKQKGELSTHHSVWLHFPGCTIKPWRKAGSCRYYVRN